MYSYSATHTPKRRTVPLFFLNPGRVILLAFWYSVKHLRQPLILTALPNRCIICAYQCMNLGKYSHTASRDMKLDKEQLKCSTFGWVQISPHGRHQITYKNRDGDVVAISQTCADHGISFCLLPTRQHGTSICNGCWSWYSWHHKGHQLWQSLIATSQCCFLHLQLQ